MGITLPWRRKERQSKNNLCPIIMSSYEGTWGREGPLHRPLFLRL